MAGRVGRALDHLEPVSVCSCVFPVTASASRSFPLFLALLGWGVRLESRGSCHSPSFGVVPRQLPSRGPVQNRVWKEWGGRGSHVAPLLNDRELSSQPLPWGPAPGVGSPGLWSLLFVKAWGGGFGGVGRRSKRLRSTPTWTWVVTGTANCALPRQHLRRFPVVHQSFVYIQESVSLHSVFTTLSVSFVWSWLAAVYTGKTGHSPNWMKPSAQLHGHQAWSQERVEESCVIFSSGP
ncbi:uncharacterized protein LOC128584034 isoform X2 [Nycticebus coucang]|uniref:uncharacterized protein LOC128584034 isoform X2 n=1 Tax=Nycticebus coucang TaxID=9470 RepID=UPI00234DB86C|nr:uncharacterized protein LOC128584034 isoform X2 [Nycticebus coucang]